MQPIVPESGLSHVVAPNRAQPLRVAVQVRDDTANVGRIEWHVNYRVRPIELSFEFPGARRLADHHRTRGGTFIESRGDLITTRRELGLVHIAAISDVVAAVFEYCRQHAAMFVRAVDAERALLQVGATRSHGVVVVEALLPPGLLEQRLMGDRRAPADVADIDRARLIK